MSFLPLNVFAEEGQEAGETPEITENSTPAEGETDGDAVPAEGKETTPEEPETTAPENQENTAGKETEQPAGGNTEAAPAENKEENVTLLAAPEKKAVRTIMMYVCGSNLESGGGYASDNLKQILGSSFSEDEDVRLIVMTGGTDEWFMEGDYLCDPDEELICIELTDVQDVVYNGEEQGPVLVYDGEVLEEGTDYQWYATGEGNYTDVNEYEVILYGNGRFTHDDIRTYRILPASIEDAEVSGVEPKEYTGKPIAQNPEIKVGNRTLKAGVDYDITYENNTEIRTATMIIAGKGNYDGMIKVQFEIAKEVYSITYDLNGGSYNGSTAAIVEKYPVGTVIAVHEASVREGYTFQYWQGSSYQPGDKYTVKEDHTLTAQWKKKQTAPDTSDYNNPGLWAGLIAVSLAVLAGVWFIRRKNG